MATPADNDGGYVACGSLLLDTNRQELRRGKAVVHLEPQVLSVAEKLMRHAERRVSCDVLIGAMYPDPDDEPGNALDVLRVRINRLRRVLERIGAPEPIINLRNENGYMIDARLRVVRSYTPEQARIADAAVAAAAARAGDSRPGTAARA